MAIVVRITDGLGNQLFQYACGYSVAQRTGQNLKLDPDFKGLRNHRKFLLQKFNIDFAETLLNKEIYQALKFEKKGKIINRIRASRLKDLRVVAEKTGYIYDNSIYKYTEEAYLTGFWQSYKYFDEYYDSLSRQFCVKEEFSKAAAKYDREMRNSNSVALHIRRTDYNRDVNNVCLTLDYYIAALKMMEDKVGEFTLFIFSDDKEFIRRNFKWHSFHLIEGLTDLEEFSVMKACKNHIIANSTFSWWATYLSENRGGYVIAPVVGIWKKEFYLPEWDTIYANFEK